jgi:cysteine desulfurase
MRIYLDHNATTPLHEAVVECLASQLRQGFGNPSSTHAEGAAARSAVERARQQVAICLGVDAREICFTAGATEANNTVLQALVWGEDVGGRHLVISETEHPSVLEPARWLEERGVDVTRLPVDAEGLLDPADLEAALRDDTALVSLIWANNETGVVQPMEKIGPLLEARGVPLHVDATQAIGKYPVDLGRVAASYVSSSAHKLGGPKGVGCLVARQQDRLPALLLGGSQERRRRGGTENVLGIVGFGVACERARLELPERMARYAALRDYLWQGIQAKVSEVRRNGTGAHVLPNTLNVEFRGAAGEVLAQALDLEGIAVSMGAACHAGAISPSHVLVAMGRSPEQARASLRFSVGQGVDETQIDRVVAVLGDLVPRVRKAGAA